MKRFSAFVSALLIICLCACTKQPKTDIYGFCNRLNSNLSEDLVDPSAYYCLDNDCYYFPSRGFMLTLSIDEARTVTRCEITLTPDEQTPDAEKTLKVFCAMCGVLCNKEPESISEVFSENSLNADKISFTESTLTFSDGNYEYFVYSNAEVISLMCEITN